MMLIFGCNRLTMLFFPEAGNYARLKHVVYPDKDPLNLDDSKIKTIFLS